MTNQWYYSISHLSAKSSPVIIDEMAPVVKMKLMPNKINIFVVCLTATRSSSLQNKFVS